MSSEAQTVIEELSRLPRLDQLAVYEAIARKVTLTDYEVLSDEDLTEHRCPDIRPAGRRGESCRDAVKFGWWTWEWIRAATTTVGMR